VWLGDLSFAEALRARKIRLAGTPALIRQFPSWLPVSRFAGVPRPQATSEDSLERYYNRRP